jgi:ribosomal protein L11 methyltransferase
MDYIELDVKVTPRQPGSDLLISGLADQGFESFAETADGFLAYIPADQFSESLLLPIQEFTAELGNAEFSHKRIPGQNWNAEWEKQYEPIRIGNRCLIRAPFHEAQPGIEIDLLIQPQQSFGTGHHPTTRLMAEKLLTMPVSGRYILDMGCGTGVLAILASRLGAAEVLGIDIETNAVENARENVERNPVKNVTIEEGTEASIGRRSFDVIVANINKNILLKSLPVYAAALRPEGDLLLSGFFTTDTDELQNAASQQVLLFSEKKTEGEWAMLHFVKN